MSGKRTDKIFFKLHKFRRKIQINFIPYIVCSRVEHLTNLYSGTHSAIVSI